MRLFVLGSFVQACCWSVARQPKVGETLTASGVTIEAGGKGLNVAICTRRLGADVDIALGVGQDNAANGLLSLLELEGVGVEHVHHLAQQSGYGAGLIGADGQNAIAVYPGPNLLINAQHITLAEKQIKLSNLVYGQFETAISAIQQAFSMAKQHGVLTVLNPSPWQSISDSILQNTDILIVNEVEACDLLKLNSLNFNQGFDQGVQPVIDQLEKATKDFYTHWQGQYLVVTLGEYGSVAFTAAGKTHYCPAPAITALDTVGAGDAFASGFCIALLEKKALPEALQYGNTCGAIVASKVGVLAALPCKSTVLMFNQQRRCIEA
jgi:ribokinase